MLRQILGGIAGYIAMFVFIFATFTVLYLVLGADGAFQAGTYNVSMMWVALSTILGLIAAIVGGYVAAALGKSGTAVKITAGIVLVMGIITIAVIIGSPGAVEARAADVSNLEAMGKAQTPLWVSVINLVVGIVGVFIGGRLRKQQ